MGNIDKVTRQYLKDNAVFADIVNYSVFNGKQVIKPDDLKEVDTAELITLNDEEGKLIEADQKFRDVLKSAVIKENEDMSIVIFGIEAQTDIDYAMPVRNLIYNALQYNKQVELIKKRHRGLKDLDSKEYPCSFSKKDRLTAVLTLTVYFGDDRWGGPKDLHEMLSTDSPDILQHIANEKLLLIEPYSLEREDLNKFNTSVKGVLGLVKYKNSTEEFKNFIDENPDIDFDADAALAINTLTGINIKVPEKGETIKMCKAMDEIIKESNEKVAAISKAEGKSEGLAEGEAKGLAKGNDLGMFNITLQFVNDGDISIEKACEKLHMSLDEFYRKKAEFENKE